MRRSLVYAAAAFVVVLVTVGFRAWSAPSTSADVDTDLAVVVPAVPGEDTRRGPSSTLFGVPGGWSHDEAGALAAAVSAVSLTGEIARAGFITRTDMIETLASGRFGPTLAAESAAQLGEMSGELGAAGVAAQSVTFSELPLTASVVHADRASAEVEVWTVCVITVADVAAPRQVWRTVTVELVWEDADWRVDGWSTVSGPTPALAVSAPVAATDEVLQVLSWSRLGGE
ncbi:MAG: hypothetical protein AB7L17_10655 [Ilumatobacteraceae bacterium]